MSQNIRPLRTHRFALSICGGISLGAYEAGVIAQLYRDLYDLNRHADIAGKAHVSIDAISGASAGSITGLIAAQGIGLGLHPDEMERLLRLCWVELLDISDLLAVTDADTQGRSIFSDQVVTKIIESVLKIPPDAPATLQEPLALWLTMTNLDGVPYAINYSRQGHAQPGVHLYALDYKDYVPFIINGGGIEMVRGRFGPHEGPTEPVDAAQTWNLAADAARASSAFPVAFPPSYQERDLAQYAEYMEFRELVEHRRQESGSGNLGMRSQGPLPTCARFQFADGGLFSNQPIGRCIDAVAHLNQLYPERDPESPASEGMAGRSFIMIDPVPQTPRDVEAVLTEPIENESDAALPTAIVGKILAAYFNSSVYADFRAAEEINRTIRRLRSALESLDGLGIPAEQVSKLKSEIIAAAGLGDKAEITLQRIPGSAGVRRKLAGEFSGHFGGFFRADYREADFITGRSEARSWLQEWLRLWLTDHAADIEKAATQIDTAYVASLLKEAPPDPETVPIPPTELTPAQLGSASWFPAVDAYGLVSYVDRLAALNTIQRREIVEQGETRLLALMQSWFHVPALLARPELFIVSRFVGPKLIDEPTSD